MWITRHCVVFIRNESKTNDKKIAYRLLTKKGDARFVSCIAFDVTYFLILILIFVNTKMNFFCIFM